MPKLARADVLGVAMVLLLSACGGDSSAPGAGASTAAGPSHAQAAESGVELDCVRDVYPCTVAEVDPAVRAREGRYVEQIHGILENGTYADALDWVLRQEAVVDADAGEHDLFFRLDGGRPTVVSRILPDAGVAMPPGRGIGGVPGLAAGMDSVQQDALLVGAASGDSGGHRPKTPGLDVVGEGTGRAHPQNRKSALFLDPLSRDKSSGFEQGLAGVAKIPDYRHPDGVRYRAAETVTPASFAGWEAFDAVFVATHGGIRPGSWLLTGLYDPVQPGEPWGDACAWLLGVEWSGRTGIDCVGVEHNGTRFIGVAVFADFFRDSYAPAVGPSSGLEKAIIYIGGCNGLLMTDIASILAGSTSAFVGWTEVTQSPWWDGATLNLLHALILGRPVSAGVDGLCNSDIGCTVPATGARFGIYDNGPAAAKLRLYDLPTFRDPTSPTSIVEPGATLAVEGVAGDGEPDHLELAVEVNGVVDPDDSSELPALPAPPPGGDPGNVWNDSIVLVAHHASPARLYDVHVFVGDERIGSVNLGSPQPGDTVEEIDATTFRYTSTFALPFDVDPEGTEATLRVAVDLPEGGISDYEVDVTLDAFPQACDLTDAGSLNAALGTALQPVPPETEPEVTLGQDWCAWREPLYEDWSKSGLWLIVNTPASGAFLDTMWEASPERQVQLPSDPGETHHVEAAFYDPSGTDNPSRITLDDGSVAIAAHATLSFRTSGTWISIQASGAVALEGDLEARLLEVAMGIAQGVNPGAAGDQ